MKLKENIETLSPSLLPRIFVIVTKVDSLTVIALSSNSVPPQTTANEMTSPNYQHNNQIEMIESVRFCTPTAVIQISSAVV